MDSLEVNRDPNPQEDPKYNQEMIDRYEKGQQAPEETQENLPAEEERPEWLPEKFKSAEDLAKAYSELEGKLGGQDDKAGDQKSSDDPSKKDAPQEDQAKEALEAKGLDMDSLSNEYAQNGGLTDESYKTLEEAGIPRAYVDAYIEGVEAKQTQFTNEIHEVAGGEAEFNSMVEWAAANMTDAQKDAYNSAMDGSINDAKAAVEGLRAQYAEANGVDPDLNLDGNGSTVTSGVYRSVPEMMADMRDPRYNTDPAFRADVEAKLGRSNIM